MILSEVHGYAIGVESDLNINCIITVSSEACNHYVASVMVTQCWETYEQAVECTRKQINAYLIQGMKMHELSPSQIVEAYNE